MEDSKSQPRAKTGGEFGANGEWYEGGKFIARTSRPKLRKKQRKPTGRQQIEAGVWAEQPDLPEGHYAMAIYPCLAGIHRWNGHHFEINETWVDYSQRMNPGADVREECRQDIDRFQEGKRWKVWKFDEEGKRVFTGRFI